MSKYIRIEHYDVFLSHANKDKVSFVDDLKRSFDKLGINIFYDKDSLLWGDSNKERIMRGIACCDFAVIVISNNFFGRDWTERELHELLSRQDKRGNKLILPILYNVSRRSMVKHYPQLDDIQYIISDGTDVSDITIQLARVLLDSKLKINGVRSDIEESIKLFFDGGSYDLFTWVAMLIENNNAFTYGPFDLVMNRWMKDIDGAMLIQESGDGYRVNPKFYKEFKEYFDREIRPQM